MTGSDVAELEIGVIPELHMAGWDALLDMPEAVMDEPEREELDLEVAGRLTALDEPERRALLEEPELEVALDATARDEVLDEPD